MGLRRHTTLQATLLGLKARVRRSHAWVVLALVVPAVVAATALHGASSKSAAEAPRAVAEAPAADTVFLHYQPVFEAAVVPVYRGLLKAMQSATEFLVVVDRPESEAGLRKALGPKWGQDPRLHVLTVTDPLGAWARDRYIPYYRDGNRWLYMPPKHLIPQRERGSLALPKHLAGRDAHVQFSVSGLNLEGGDVILTGTHALVGVRTVDQHTHGNPRLLPRFRKDIESLFGRTLLVVGSSPDRLPYDHIDMFLSAADDKTLLLGDPSLALKILAPARDATVILDDDTLGSFLRSTQERMAPLYDDLARQLVAEGFRVVRVPSLHGEPFWDGRPGAVLNWNNALLDRGAGRAFVPHYGVAALDETAWKTWRGAGFEVVPIDARGAVALGGAVRCLTTAFFTADAQHPGAGAPRSPSTD